MSQEVGKNNHQSYPLRGGPSKGFRRGFSVLDAGERDQFAEWLRRRVEKRGVANKRLLPGNASYAKKVLRGKFPGIRTLRALAPALGVPLSELLIRAGYYDALLCALPTLAQIARQKLEDDRLPLDDLFLDAECEVLPDGRPLPKGYCTLETLGGRNLLAPIALHDAVFVAIGAFPRRGDYYLDLDYPEERHVFMRIDFYLHRADFEIDRRVSPPCPLDFAVEALKYTRLSVDLRKAIAGEFTHEWAFQIAPTLAAEIRRRVYATWSETLAHVMDSDNVGSSWEDRFELTADSNIQERQEQ